MEQERGDQPGRVRSPPKKRHKKKEPLADYDPMLEVEKQIDAAIRSVLEPRHE